MLLNYWIQNNQTEDQQYSDTYPVGWIQASQTGQAGIKTSPYKVSVLYLSLQWVFSAWAYHPNQYLPRTSYKLN